jgi:NADH-quinone oxidoreductase subunit H
MIINAFIIVILFFGGWLSVFYLLPVPSIMVKVLFFCFLWIFVRAGLPRYRYDQVMSIGWKTFLPLTISIFIFYITLGIATNAFPYTNQIPYSL